MACSVTIYSNFTSHGKKENGFYSNVDKITKWQEEYNFPHGVVDLFDELNHCGKASTHIPSRAYFTAYVLSNEGYDVTICPVHDMIL